jgi:hypothetical protein
MVAVLAAATAVAAAAAEVDGVAVALGEEARAVRLVGMVAKGVTVQLEEAWVVGRGWAALAARTGWRCEWLQW